MKSSEGKFSAVLGAFKACTGVLHYAVGTGISLKETRQIGEASRGS